MSSEPTLKIVYPSSSSEREHRRERRHDSRERARNRSPSQETMSPIKTLAPLVPVAGNRRRAQKSTWKILENERRKTSEDAQLGSDDTLPHAADLAQIRASNKAGGSDIAERTEVFQETLRALVNQSTKFEHVYIK